MDARRWQTITRHLEEIAELGPAEREQALARLDAQDPDLASEVRSLLDADDEAFLAEPAAALLEQDDLDDPILPSGTMVGPYRVAEVLGEGGMGIVYLADRVDEQFERRVALKIIKRGMDTRRVIRRFQAERQILASLAHPSIATLYDGGMTDDGVPYFCMEYVDGLPIDEYCERQGLPLAERLRLLSKACGAVQHAHRNLVVHGDLKPSNVLVTAEGQVKLLDFGIATLLDDRTGSGAPLTSPGFRPLTPDFASPEQVRGEPLTTAADVWSLGVLLHILLTGQRPNDLSAIPPHDLARAMDDLALPRPSATGGAWARRLRGDLDTIVQVAMHPDAGRRYPSANALAEDLGSHLSGHPISARRDSMSYRARKFVTRNRVGVTLTAMAFALTLGFALTMGYQANRIEGQNVEIARQRDRAEEVTSVLVDMFDVSDPVQGSVARGDTLRVLDFLRMNEERLTTELGEQPDLHATFCHLMSRLYANLGHYDRAHDLIRESVTIRRDIALAPDEELAKGLDFLGTVLDRLGRPKEAEAHIREALEMRRELHDGPHFDLAESLNNLAWSLSNQDRNEEALELDFEALEMRRKLLGDGHTEVAQSLNNLASSLLYLDRLEEAEPLFREALAIRRQTLGPDHPYVANTMNNLGRLMYDLDDLAAADSLVTGAIEIWTRSLRPDHPRVSAGWLNLSLVAEKKGQIDRAVDAMARALAIDEAALPEGHPYVAQDRLELGRLILAAGRSHEAIPLLEMARDWYLETGGPDDEEAQRASLLLARAEEEEG